MVTTAKHSSSSSSSSKLEMRKEKKKKRNSNNRRNNIEKILERGKTVRRSWSTHQSVVHQVEFTNHDPLSNPIRSDQIFNRISNRSKFPVPFLSFFLLLKNRAEFGSPHVIKQSTPLGRCAASVGFHIEQKGEKKAKKKRDNRKRKDMKRKVESYLKT